jgi:hypothetical protein
LKSGLNLQGGNAGAAGHGRKREHLLQTHSLNSYQSINQLTNNILLQYKKAIHAPHKGKSRREVLLYKFLSGIIII